jgi:RNA recognition motif. (a.k.a. RRM, RBD, or RNP domain)
MCTTMARSPGIDCRHLLATEAFANVAADAQPITKASSDVQRCGKIKQVIIPTNDDLSNKGFAYVQFEFEESVPKAMRLRPGQVGNRPVNRFKRSANPYVKRMHNHSYSFTQRNNPDLSGSRALASHQLSMAGTTLRDESSPGDNNEDDLHKHGSSASSASAQQAERAARLSAGLSSTGYVHPGSLKRPASQSDVAGGTTLRAPNTMRLTKQSDAQSSRRTTRDSITVQPAAMDAPSMGTHLEEASAHQRNSAGNAASGPLPRGDPGTGAQYMLASSSEDLKKPEADTPIDTMQPISPQVWPFMVLHSSLFRAAQCQLAARVVDGLTARQAPCLLLDVTRSTA